MALLSALLVILELVLRQSALTAEASTESFSVIQQTKSNLENFSYLEMEIPIKRIHEKIFPAKLEISLTINSAHGILFYSIDNSGNQLILQFEDAHTDLAITFRDQTNYVNLTFLCGCSRPDCFMHRLDFTIKMRSHLQIECNNGKLVKYAVPQNIRTREGFPRPKLKEWYLVAWLVNIPAISKVSYPDPKQMTGCIHAVRYRDSAVGLTARGPHIKLGCPDACTSKPNVCNLGSCVGTFENEPVCNCTSALLIGKNCTNNLDRNASKSDVLPGKIKSLKVSWTDNPTSCIFLLQIKNVSISFIREEQQLSVKTSYSTIRGNRALTEPLSHRYNPHSAHTAILRFLGPSILIQMPLDNNLISLIHLAHSPESQIINLTLHSQSGGAADAGYKLDDLDYEWTTIQWRLSENQTVFTNRNKKAILWILLALLIGRAIWIIFLKFKFRLKWRFLRYVWNFMLKQLSINAIGTRGLKSQLKVEENQKTLVKYRKDIERLTEIYCELEIILDGDISQYLLMVKSRSERCIKDLEDFLKSIKDDPAYTGAAHVPNFIEANFKMIERIRKAPDDKYVDELWELTRTIQLLLSTILNMICSFKPDSKPTGSVPSGVQLILEDSQQTATANLSLQPTAPEPAHGEGHLLLEELHQTEIVTDPLIPSAPEMIPTQETFHQ